MAKVEGKTTHVWCHKLRIAVILATLRHFCDKLNAARVRVHQKTCIAAGKRL
ncbi:MAG TPA: cryptochrome/photolyase family protein [Gammaproteobacteria bacterium]|nr:cryptochrome/photolyase family protein [Gammaproteobacteria bacterium]HKH20892.1 cryptochrome/photolyase family protein [Gammaproteobacteria bacterium]